MCRSSVGRAYSENALEHRMADERFAHNLSESLSCLHVTKRSTRPKAIGYYDNIQCYSFSSIRSRAVCVRGMTARVPVQSAGIDSASDCVL